MSLSTRVIQAALLATAYHYRKPIADHLDESWRAKNPSPQQLQQSAMISKEFQREGVKNITVSHYLFGSVIHNNSSFFNLSLLPIKNKVFSIENKPSEFSVKIKKF